MEEISRKELSDALKGIILWPGSKEEFEKFISYKTSWVDLGGRVKGLEYYERCHNPFHHSKKEIQDKIFDEGVVALVNSSPIGEDIYFGIPVKKK